jgi:hypothetical protein
MLESELIIVFIKAFMLFKSTLNQFNFALNEYV